jgi:hypothetical protein
MSSARVGYALLRCHSIEPDSAALHGLREPVSEAEGPRAGLL